MVDRAGRRGGKRRQEMEKIRYQVLVEGIQTLRPHILQYLATRWAGSE